VLSAKNLAACDIGGKSDPYFVLTIESKDGKVLFTDKSDVQKNTLEPVWNKRYVKEVDETFKGELIRYFLEFVFLCLSGVQCSWNDTYSIMVYDSDAIGKDDFMGQAIIKLDEDFWKYGSSSEKKKLKKVSLKLKGREGKKDDHVKGKLLGCRVTYCPKAMEKKIENYLRTCREIEEKEEEWKKKKKAYEEARDSA
tara:strand:+ start:593 stop:1180 length:588 start_codon:yes stop_codon:yes gene_type:complete